MDKASCFQALEKGFPVICFDQVGTLVQEYNEGWYQFRGTVTNTDITVRAAEVKEYRDGN